MGAELGKTLSKVDRYPFTPQPSSDRIVRLEVLRGEPFTTPYDADDERDGEDGKVVQLNKVHKG